MQPLVENAIKHGVAPSKTGADVEVIGEAIEQSNGGRLQLTVRNTGMPLRSDGGPVRGDRVGVENIRRRLRGHYGAGAMLTLTADPAGGTVATIVMPIAPEHNRVEDLDDVNAIASSSR